MEETYGHTPLEKMFGEMDVYAVRPDPKRAERRPLRLGVIGVGGVAQSKHIPAILRLQTMWEPVTLAAFADPNEEQGRKVERMLRGTWYADHREMLSRESLDGVLVLSPDALHFDHAVACLDAGVPVVVEKPLTTSLMKSYELCEQAKRKGLLLMTVSNKRYSPPYRVAKRLLDTGQLKNPALFYGKFHLGYPYVNLLEGGTVHLFDLLRCFMGDVAVLRAYGTQKSAATTYFADNIALSFTCVSGAVGSLQTSCTALSAKPWEQVEIVGERAWLEVEDQWELRFHSGESVPTQRWRPVIPNTLMFDEEFGGYLGEIENFLQAIRGVETPRVTGWDGHKALELVVATRMSIAENREISLPLDVESADVFYQRQLNDRPTTRREYRSG